MRQAGALQPMFLQKRLDAVFLSTVLLADGFNGEPVFFREFPGIRANLFAQGLRKMNGQLGYLVHLMPEDKRCCRRSRIACWVSACPN